jgi:hypothetical protein
VLCTVPESFVEVAERWDVERAQQTRSLGRLLAYHVRLLPVGGRSRHPSDYAGISLAESEQDACAFVFGPHAHVEWITHNPGAQDHLVGSFHPVPAALWDFDVFVDAAKPANTELSATEAAFQEPAEQPTMLEALLAERTVLQHRLAETKKSASATLEAERTPTCVTDAEALQRQVDALQLALDQERARHIAAVTDRERLLSASIATQQETKKALAAAIAAHGRAEDKIAAFEHKARSDEEQIRELQR